MGGVVQVVCTLTALTDLSLKSNELTALTPLVGNLVELRSLDVRLLLALISLCVRGGAQQKFTVNLHHLQTI